MMINQTLDQLHDLRLTAMAQEIREQMERPDSAAMDFEERFGLAVDRQWMYRENERLKRRLKGAHHKQSNACLEDVDYRASRGLDRKVMQELATCRWIRAGRNVILTGATGLGKTWLACALSNRACRDGLTSQYHRVPRLVHELAIARADGTYLKVLSRLSKLDLLVLDDWGLSPLEGQAQHDVLEVVDDRAGNKSTLVTSQLPLEKWHDMVADPSVADALLDRLVGAATLINLKGGSLRKPELGQ